MKTHSPAESTAVSARHFDAMLAISSIYFKGMSELSELASTTARETVGECLSAASEQDVAALQARLGQPMLARIAASSTQWYQIVSRSQQEVAKVVATQFSVPFMQDLMPPDVDTAMKMFSRGLGKLATINASNIAAATEAAAGVGEVLGQQPKKAA